MKDFLARARELRGERRAVVGIFREPALAGYEVPRSLRPDHFLEVWGTRADVHVVFLDAEEIRSYSILFRGRLDLLVYPYGEIYPMDAPTLYSCQTLQHFLQRGGALLTTGGVPFGLPLNLDRPAVVNGTDPRARLDQDPYRYEKWVAPLGVKYYLHPYVPTVTEANVEYLPSLSAGLDVAGCPLGIVINNSSHEPEPKPPHGNVFPERYPARQVIPLLTGKDRYGQALATNALLVQDFETGSRRVHFAHETEPHPLSSQSPYFAALLNDVLDLLLNRVVAKDVRTTYACYRQSEAVDVSAELVSFEANPTDVEVALEIRTEGETVYLASEQVRVAGGEATRHDWTWKPERFTADEYDVILRVRRGGRTVSGAENGFVVWDDVVACGGPRVDLAGKYFHLGSGESFVTGTNYYESTRGEIMWHRPAVHRIARDLRQMREHGVNLIRPHYHHLKWFADYLRFQHGYLFDFYRDLESLDGPLPDERVWRIWDAFIYLCQKLGIVYGGDLFTLVPEEMGDPRGWFPLRESIYCADKRAVQREFLRQLNLRYRDVPGIIWDLWNEPVVPIESLRDWTADLRETLVQTGVPRPITVGGGTGEELGNLVDYVAPHARASTVRGKVNESDRPVLIQEMHLDRPEGLENEFQQAEDLREGVVAALRNGLAGVMPWSWCRQMRLWQDVYQHHHTFPMEKWDDRLGMHVHEDGTIKVAGQVFRDLATLARSFHLVDFDPATRRVLTDRGEIVAHLGATSQQQGYSIHHVSGERCYAAMELTSATWGGSLLVSGPRGSYVYIYGDDGDVRSASRVFAKSERPGHLVVRRPGPPRSVQLVDLTPLGARVLDSLAWEQRPDGPDIDVAPTQQAYWVRVDW